MYAAIIYSAIALVLVFVAMFPFLSPGLVKQIMTRITARSDKTIRRIGFVGLMLGTSMMIVVHSMIINL